MFSIRFFARLLFLAALLLAPTIAQGCPLCAEAVAAGSDAEDEVSYFAESMNQSIYLMIAVPYSCLGIVGFMIYRAKRHEE